MKNIYKYLLAILMVAASAVGNKTQAQTNGGFEYSGKCLTLTFWSTDKRATNSCSKVYWSVNGTYPTGSQMNYTFPKAGSYQICMKIKDTCKKWDTTVCKTIIVSACDNPCNLTPSFTWKVDCRKVKFVASGGIAGATYYWNFGNGSSASTADPSATFVKDGVYKVCLYMSWKDPNTGQTCKKEVCKEVKVQCGAPCNIKGDYQFYTSGSTVKFFGSSNNGVYYAWDFGDGTTGSGKDLYHVYKKPGTYNVCVTITDKTKRCSVKICKKVVIVDPCNVKGDFSFSKTGTGSFKFKAASTNGVYYVWSFGDGTTGTGMDPSHTYTKPGTYTVCVTIYARNEKCKTKICKTVVVSTQEKCNWAKLGAGFTYSVNCPKLTLEAKNLSSTNCIKYYYSVTNPAGNVTKYYGKVQTIVVATGNYKVCLTLYDSCKKCDTVICKELSINCPKKCNWAAQKPSFTLTDSCKTLNGYVGFHTDNAGCYSYTWKVNGTIVSKNQTMKDFGITKNGTYYVCVYVKDSCNGCDTVICGTRAINCFKTCNWKSKYPNFTTFSLGAKCKTISAGLNTSSVGCIKQYYSIAGGSFTTDGKTYRDFTVEKNGTYIVCLKLVDTCNGCDTTICKQVAVNCEPCSWRGTDFSVSSNASKCMYTFTGNVTNNGCLKYKYSMSANSGSATTIGSGRVLDYQMTKNGSYTICMTVTDTCKKCDTTICKTVKVDCACSAKASFTIDSVTTAGVMYITNTSSGASSYSWDFGDSSSSSSSAPGKHAYKTSGYYTICLTVWDANKTCSTKYCVSIKVNKTRSAASTSSISNALPVHIYPNPASNSFIITTMGNASYQVIDLNGKLVTEGTILNNTTINSNHWMNGVYLVRVTNSEGVGTCRIVIQK